MREILFRGKRPNGQWVQGDLTLYRIDEKVISKISFHQTRATLNGLRTATYTDDVIPETIGQYTGLTDKNGTKIFEGDIVKTKKGKLYEIKVRNGSWVIWNNKYELTYEKWDFLSTFAPKVEIIGNIHDNSLEDFESGS